MSEEHEAIKNAALIAVARYAEGGGQVDEGETIRVSPLGFALLIMENLRLSEKVDELQMRGSEMTKERQRWRDPHRRQELAAATAAKCGTFACNNEFDQAAEWEIAEAMRELVEAP